MHVRTSNGEFAESQFYAEPKRLERLGYLSSRKEPGRTRERTHYTLTQQGLDAVRRWAAEPAGFSRLGALRGEIEELRARLGTADEVAATIPHRERYLRLNHRLARRLVDAHAEWLDEVERELGSDGARRARQGGARAARAGGRRGA